MALKTHKSVGDMVAFIFQDDPDFVQEFHELTYFTGAMSELRLLRHHLSLTQNELAEKLGWSQSKVSRFEDGDSRSIKLGDLRQYAKALGMEVEITFTSVCEVEE